MYSSGRCVHSPRGRRRSRSDSRRSTSSRCRRPDPTSWSARRTRVSPRSILRVGTPARPVEGVHRLHLVGQRRRVQPRGSEVAIGSADGKIDIVRSKVWSRMRSITDAGQVTALDYDASRRSPHRSLCRWHRAIDPCRRRFDTRPRRTVVRRRLLGVGAHDASPPRRGPTERSHVAANGSGIGPARYLPLPSAFGHPDGIGAIAPDARVVASGNAGARWSPTRSTVPAPSTGSRRFCRPATRRWSRS